MIKNKQRRVHKEFAKEMDEIKRKRIALGMDKPHRPISDSRITRSILLNRNWQFIKDEAIRLPRDPSLDKRRRKK